MFRAGDIVIHKIFDEDYKIEVVDGKPFDEDCFCGKRISQKFNFYTLGAIYDDFIIENHKLVNQ